MPSVTIPSWPEEVQAHPLLVIDYKLIKSGDKQETDKLWKAATELGFWYQKNSGTEELADEMFDMGRETMVLPLEEKMKFEQGDSGMSHGYKAQGGNATGENAAPDTVEFLNVAKDDVLSYPKIAKREYPSTVNARMESTLRPYIEKSIEVNATLIEIFNQRLGLPEGTLAKKHPIDESSGSETRIVHRAAGSPVEKIALGGHTDFGSVSFLHHRLGGLQVLVPGTDEWQHVKPIPGHAIVNLGDAMTIFSGGILRSNMHRVVPPPGYQCNFDRWALVYFTRPGGSVILRPLVEDSPMIATAVEASQTKYEHHSTAAEWFSRRIKNQRLKNQSGPETWRASRGTEHQPLQS